MSVPIQHQPGGLGGWRFWGGGGDPSFAAKYVQQYAYPYDILLLIAGRLYGWLLPAPALVGCWLLVAGSAGIVLTDEVAWYLLLRAGSVPYLGAGVPVSCSWRHLRVAACLECLYCADGVPLALFVAGRALYPVLVTGI